MKILSFVYSFPPYQGGSGMGHYDLLRRITDYIIDVVTYNYGSAPRIEHMGHMTVYRLDCWTAVQIYPIPKPTLWNIKVMLSMLFAKHDLVYTRTRFFTSSALGLLASWVKGIPLVHTEPGTCYVVTGKRMVDLIAWIWDNTIGRMIARHAYCIGVSYASIEMMRRLGARRCYVVYNGVDKDIFIPNTHRPSNRQFTALYVGRLKWTKGIDILNEAARILKGLVRIVACGDGEYQCCQEIAMRGQMERQQIAKLMQTSSVLVHPSRMEGLSRVIQEAQTVGLPVIATDVGGNKELIQQNKTGLLIDTDAYDLSTKLLMLKANPAFGMAYSENARHAAKLYDWDVTIKSYRAIFEKVRAK